MDSNFIEGSHYYFDQSLGSKGVIVFTELYHMNRGYCCGNKCRHCPYEPKHVRGTKSITVKKNYTDSD